MEIKDDCEAFISVFKCNTSLSNSSSLFGESSDALQQTIHCNESLPSCSTVDGLSEDVIQVRTNVLMYVNRLQCMILLFATDY